LSKVFSSFYYILKKVKPSISVIFTIILLILSFFIFSKLAMNDKMPAKANNNLFESNPNKEMRGVWVATVTNINFPSQGGISSAAMKAELDDIVKTAKDANLNAIFFQVRPTADAFYPSDIFPWSVYLTGKGKNTPDGNFDPLAYILKISHENGIALHAWVNPYRVSMNTTNVNDLAQNSPARLHPEYTIPYADGKLYFNPGLPEVRKLVVDGVRELLTKYPDLDGIHFDDYFYPYPKDNVAFNDTDAFTVYGNGMALADWRRENVNELIRETHQAIKELSPSCRFGVSPFGIWANETSNTPVKGSLSSGFESYFSLYCDPLTWAKEGTVDYLAPQDYWSFNTGAAPFDNIARWWNANLDGTNVDLYIGHAVYKAASFTRNEIPIQIEFARSLLKYKGSIFYGYADIKANTVDVKADLTSVFNHEIIYPSIKSTGEPLSINFPLAGETAESGVTNVLGSSDPAYPVSYMGAPVSRTKGGYFALYTTLRPGENSVSVFQNGSAATQVINYTVTRNASAPSTLDSFAITECTPSANFTINTGDTLTVTCTAPAGSNVVAAVGGMSIKLSPTIHPQITSGKMMREVYTGSIKPSTFASAGNPATLGTLKINAVYNGESITKTIGLVTQVMVSPQAPAAPSIPQNTNDPNLGYAEVVNNYSYVKTSVSSSFYDDYTPASKGMRDYIMAEINGFYQLRFGGYISEDNVSVTKNTKLYANQILSVAVQVNAKNTSNNKNNSTDIRFGVLDNVPVNINITNNFLYLTLSNTNPSYIKQVQVPPNPLISSISGAPGMIANTVVYTVTLKNADNYYGADIVYENNMIICKLNNPQSIEKGALPLSGKTIVVDAGHGGTDTGALGPANNASGLREKNLNLSIALELQKKLNALGATVLMTRTTDTTVSLNERIDFLNKATPDFAIAIHHNSVAATSNAAKTYGFLGLYSNNSGILLAKTVSSVVTKELNRYERPVNYQQLAVARNHRFPSMLCEMCFISNPEEFQWSINDGSYEKSAEALADGILEYFKAQENYLVY